MYNEIYYLVPVEHKSVFLLCKVGFSGKAISYDVKECREVRRLVSNVIYRPLQGAIRETGQDELPN